MSSNEKFYILHYYDVRIGELKNVYMAWLYDFKKQHSFHFHYVNESPSFFFLLAHSDILNPPSRHPFSPIFTHNTIIRWNSNGYVCTSGGIVNSPENIYMHSKHI